MSDYTSRAEELLKQIETLTPILGEEQARRVREAITNYLPRRTECLNELIKILEDDSDGNRDNASRWRDRCNTMRATAASTLENAVRDVQGTPEALAAAGRWHLALLAQEERFFAGLAVVKAAEVRDYLVTTRSALQKYIEDLRAQWRGILDASKQLQAEEKSIYLDMTQQCEQAIRNISETQRSLPESTVKALLVAAQAAANDKGASVMAAGLAVLLKKLGVEIEGLSDIINQGGKVLEKKLEEYLANNKYLWERMERYRSLVNAERGGVLPLFKETRRRVYEYWQRTNPSVAQDRVTVARSSLGDWQTVSATAGQQDDARRFADDAGKAILVHYERVQSVAGDFQKEWDGVFNGPLSASTQDQLFDVSTWRMNAEKLIAAPVPAAMERLAADIDGYFEVSFERPLEELKSILIGLDDPEKEPAVRAVEMVQQKIREAIRSRIVAFKSAAEDSRRLLGASAVNTLFERANMRSDAE